MTETIQQTCDILLLEDVRSVRQLLAYVLAEKGWEVVQAASAAEAWSMLHSRGARVLIADNFLGLKDHGHAFAAEAAAQLPGLGVIYISRSARVLMDRELGPRERVLVKPFLPRELTSLVSEVLAA